MHLNVYFTARYLIASTDNIPTVCGFGYNAVKLNEEGPKGFALLKRRFTTLISRYESVIIESWLATVARSVFSAALEGAGR